MFIATTYINIYISILFKTSRLMFHNQNKYNIFPRLFDKRLTTCKYSS